MTLENSVRLWAGVMTLISVVLIWQHSPYWLLLTAFIGLNLVQSSFTGFCGAAIILKKLFFKQSSPVSERN